MVAKNKSKDDEYDELADELEDDEDLEYDDEEDHGFHIEAAIKPPNSHPVSCYDLYTQIQEGIISLEADYQRDVVWNDAKQSNLVDSIYKDYFIPPVLFAKRKDEDGEEILVCIDGKQRLTSVHRFMDGYIPMKVNGKSWYYQRRGNRGPGKVIPEGWKKQFASKQLIVGESDQIQNGGNLSIFGAVVEFADLSQATERDIFQRVQLGMALNEAEKQKAISSPTVSWIRNLVTRYFEGDTGIPQFLTINTKRSKDFQCVAQFVYMANALPAFDMPAAAKLSKFLQQQEERNVAFKQAVDKAISDLSDLVQEKSCVQLVGTIPLAPVELVHILLLCLLLSGRSRRVQAKSIGDMRKVIRDNHVDVRANTRVARSFAEHLKTLRAPGVPGPEVEWQVEYTGGKGTRSRKRKEVDEDEDMLSASEDDRPVPSTSARGRGKPRGRPKGSGRKTA